MASIGAIPVRGHWGDEKLGEDTDVIYFDETILLEWSIVPIGSNPDALKREVDLIETLRQEKTNNIDVTDVTLETPALNVREREFLLNSK